MGRMGRAAIGAALAMLAGGPAPAAAEIMLSANDAKQIRAGDGPLGSASDTVSVIEVAGGRPRVLATLDAPASLIGPPATAALSPDGRMGIVTASQAVSGDTPPKLVPAGPVTVLDLSRPKAPRIAQRLQAGMAATGVAFDPRGRLALIANAGDDSISVYRVRRGRIALVDTLKLDTGTKPMMIRFAPDGRSAWVVLQTADSIARLAIAGDRVTATGDRIATGKAPYSLSIAPGGRLAFVTNLNGRIGAAPATPAIGTIAVVDLAGRAVLEQVDAGSTPEHVAIAPDGRHLLATIVNGSTAAPTSSNYRDHGLLRVYAVGVRGITPVAEARTGRWCQGAAWTRDGRSILQQCADRREIETYRFDGRTLARDDAATLMLGARPGALAALTAR